MSLAFSLGVRMKTTVMVILLHMACCLGAPLSGQSGNSSSPEGELRAVMAELHKAALEGDTEKTVSLMTMSTCRPISPVTSRRRLSG